ncbi:Retinal dehydrogenase [Scedosporium apiospermum]|uniref:aldehyde dehydrogenase (NAD(+)) n=1 Tax=Pseudallescheria apiosperma TaxID=563466 RepID=A0A084G2M4_PSEDA|nr:Retinal dehydrogenase [Scedosporium apiospermum]KEZ41586.1 Retinal dehydrogenase [Scedosporium apiospermum]
MSTPILNPKDFGKLFLNGEYVEARSDKTLTLLNPKDNTVVADNVPIAGEEDVELAVRLAEDAFAGPWSSFSASQRTTCLLKLAELLESRLDDIMYLDSLTTGNPVSLMATREKGYIRSCVLYYAGWTDKQRGDYFPDDDGFVKLVRHEPLGVCAAINPFNAPVASFILKAAPCLATGNVLIVKPSEKSPLGSLAIATLFEEAGFPKGVVQVLSGDGTTGALLAKHMRIRKISFTGSILTGKKIQEAAAQSNLKRVTLELGGKSPAIIFDDANLENALTWTINGILTRCGQLCIASSRVYVQKGIAGKFIQAYRERMADAVERLGDPQVAGTTVGPLVDQGQFERVKAMIARGTQEAELVVGGSRFGSDGCFIEPTVFLNPKPDAQILKEEIFGPVAVVMTFDTEEEVIKAANDTEFGLTAGVFTKDIARALRVSSKVDSGLVGINCISVTSMQAPFGGRKQSGIGREFGEYALRAFTEPKTVLIK